MADDKSSQGKQPTEEPRYPDRQLPRVTHSDFSPYRNSYMTEENPHQKFASNQWGPIWILLLIVGIVVLAIYIVGIVLLLF